MSVLTLDKAKRLIASAQADRLSTSDADIQAVIDAAEGVVAEVVGPLTPTPVTAVVWMARTGGVLAKGPYIGPVTAVASYDGDIAALSVAGGILTGLPVGRWLVTYTAGWSAVPPAMMKALEEQFIHLWSFRRGNTRQVETIPGGAHAMPYRVAEMLAPYRRVNPA